MNIIDQANLESELKGEFEKICINVGEQRGDTVWTVQLKSLVAKVGTARGFKVCTSGFADDYDGEWLYDLLWYREDEEGRLSELFLVLESEWMMNFKHLKYDFEKLLITHAPMKIFVFQHEGPAIDSVVERLQSAVEAYRIKDGATYLFAGYRWDKEQFEFWRYGRSLTRKGM